MTKPEWMHSRISDSLTMKQKKVKDDQDAFCHKVEAEEWESLCDQDRSSESLQWSMS
jgi:hypothetical protein